MYRLTLLALICFSVFSPAQAAEFSLFSMASELTSSKQAITQADGIAPAATVIGRQVSTSDQLKQAQGGDTISFQSPNGDTLRIIIERDIRHPNGDVSLMGHLAGEGSDYSATITRGAQGTFATINAADGQYKIEIRDGQEWFSTPTERRNMVSPPFVNDGIAPPPQQDSLLKSHPPLAQSSSPPPAAASTTVASIDILVLYTPEFATGLGGTSAAQTRINHLVTLSNQAYIDSQLFTELNVVHTEQINAPNDEGGGVALANFRQGNGVFSTVGTLRTNKGADIVLLLQKFTPAHTTALVGCGLAYILGSGNGSLQNSAAAAYGIVRDGSYQNPNNANQTFFCPETTFPHELGHNFGFSHDRNHAGASGIFPYSYGHDSPNTFATIMSYDTPAIARFSNPNIMCNGQPCGIAEGAANSADNVKSGNLVRFDIANFYPHVSTGVLPGDTDNSGSVTIQDVISIINIVLGSNPSVAGANCDGVGGVDISDVICAINAVLAS